MFTELNKIFKFTGIWLLGLLAVYILISLPLVAGIFRGKQAFQALTYGYPNLRAQFKYHPWSCDIQKLMDQDSCKIDFTGNGINFGMYDPNGQFDNYDSAAITHYYIQWNTYQAGQVLPDLSTASSRNRWPLITVEPYPFDNNKDALFADIANGVYDEVTQSICNDIQTFGKPVFVRWGHEMENVTGRYPWASRDSGGYKTAYKHFVDQCRAIASQIYYVWSPVGSKELERYWPSREYVDYVGLSVYEYPQWDIYYFKKERSFEEIFGERYRRVEQYNRPIMIAELGVFGSNEYQKSWLADGFRNLSKYSLLKSLVYFNAKDTEGVWGENFATPDWSIDSRIFD